MHADASAESEADPEKLRAAVHESRVGIRLKLINLT